MGFSCSSILCECFSRVWVLGATQSGQLSRAPEGSRWAAPVANGHSDRTCVKCQVVGGVWARGTATNPGYTSPAPKPGRRTFTFTFSEHGRKRYFVVGAVHDINN
ncbi:hypothetical protein TIFTF001_014725 [Ficus carica]|uniref:Uncharacterized protein n=1 Tax=Ficus carica TaxID=3494 RepID=A0AA88AGK9_FICCA|nr:hypothetical protein TIFTF001_014725 [Ficus carica]